MKNLQIQINSLGPVTRYVYKKHIPELNYNSDLAVYQVGKTLIDMGSMPAAPALLEALNQNPIDRILLTHQHEDHTGGLNAIAAVFKDIPVYCPDEHLDIIRQGYKVPEHRQLFWGGIEPFAGVTPYGKTGQFQEGDYQISIVDTPGHTVGHKAIHVHSTTESYMISGDLYLAPRLPNAFYETSVPDIIESLEKLAGINIDWLLPSHGKVYNDASIRLNKLADWYKNERDKILLAADTLNTRDYRQIFKYLYKEYNNLEKITLAENSRLALIRGVLDPVKTLPASALAL